MARGHALWLVTVLLFGVFPQAGLSLCSVMPPPEATFWVAVEAFLAQEGGGTTGSLRSASKAGNAEDACNALAYLLLEDDICDRVVTYFRPGKWTVQDRYPPSPSTGLRPIW